MFIFGLIQRGSGRSRLLVSLCIIELESPDEP